MSKVNDILTAYQSEDTKNLRITSHYLSIAPMKKGDGAVQTSIQVPQDAINGSHDSTYLRERNNFDPVDIVNIDAKRKINLYREIMAYPEVDNIVSQIVADSIVYDEKKRFVTLDLDETDFSPKIKARIQEEFETILKLYRSKREAKRLYKNFYVDSKLFFHKVIDPNNPKRGILELREIDPRLMTLKRRNLVTTNNRGEDVWVGYEDYFLYEMPYLQNNTGFDYSHIGSGSHRVIEIPRSAIVYAYSGLVDCKDQVVGHLHQAIKPAHTLKMLEMAMVIYRITRSPDRKIFYIDTGKANASQAREIMNRVRREHSSKVTYDPETGKFDAYKNQLLVTDDYWLQRQEGHANAEITQLPGATGMNEIDDIKWHNKKLYEALKVPLSRMPNENVVMFGDDGGTSRDERIYQKQVDQNREFFSEIFADPLKTNLVLKGVLTIDEWNENEESLVFRYRNDEYFTEIAQQEILDRRINIVEKLEQFRGKYISGEYIMKNVLKYTDEQIEEIRQQIKDEQDDTMFNPPIKLDQYGNTIDPADIGTQSTEIEYVIPPEIGNVNGDNAMGH